MGGDYDHHMPEPYRIPGDALELMRYQLERAQAEIEELEQEVERLNNRYDDICIEAGKLWDRNRELEAQIDNALEIGSRMEADRDNWRAKAEG